MSLPIEAKWISTEALWMQSNRANIRCRLGIRHPLFLIGYPLLMVVIIIAELVSYGRLDVLGFVAAFMMIFVLTWNFWILPFRWRRIYRSLPVKNTELKWVFGDDVICCSSVSANSEVKWTAFLSAGHSRDGVLLFPQKNFSYWIPATAFASSGDFEHVIELVKSRVPKTKSFR